ncbi:MarR family winged helix-turn-helix transcriptional regulator [Desulfogranum mediterraneum]|uniref:MarR family winged helix-turn-helix transcriptional regulator n=1 Tax=Desulfogranum mediterraneum TaxID=160661 RepID=UPI0003F87880|nr:MarR family transcriptional regulator [Desulfogranum mediterraneum]
MEQPGTLERARYIFRVGKMMQHHIFSSFARLEVERHEDPAMELSVTQFKLVMTVRQYGEVTLKELAAKLEVSPPSVSVMVDKLVERGLLTRERSAQDRRKVVIRVSPDELANFDEMEEKVLQVFVQLLEDLGPDIAQKWEEVLVRVEQVLAQRQQGETPARSGG